MVYSKNIFLADDDCDDVDFFKAALSEIAPDIKLTVANGGQELIEKLSAVANAPDTIFLDINMPKLDGIAALRIIRNELPYGKKIPVIIYSTSDDEFFIRRAYEAGANCFFTKPTNFRELKSCIANFLQADWAKTTLPYEEFAVVV